MDRVRNKAYENLKELLDEISNVNASWSGSQRFIEWGRSVETALRKLFPGDNIHLRDFKKVHYSPLIITSSTTDRMWQDSFMRGVKSAKAIITSALNEIEEYELVETTSKAMENGLKKDNRRIFVVHGHDNEMKESVARYLEKLNFDPIILHELASGGGTVIEKIEKYSDVGYAVILLSPDDVGAKKDQKDNLQLRARQNVVLELGFFIGSLGRSHVTAILRGKLELPSDFEGIVYVPYEGDSWKLQILSELKSLGYDVDANNAF